MYIYMYTGMGKGGPKCRNLQMKISVYSYNNKSTPDSQMNSTRQKVTSTLVTSKQRL